MKTAEQWQEELAGETSVEAIRQIQTDAMFKRDEKDELFSDLIAALLAAEVVLDMCQDAGYLTAKGKAIAHARTLMEKAKGRGQGQGSTESRPTVKVEKAADLPCGCSAAYRTLCPHGNSDLA